MARGIFTVPGLGAPPADPRRTVGTLTTMPPQVTPSEPPSTLAERLTQASTAEIQAAADQLREALARPFEMSMVPAHQQELFRLQREGLRAQYTAVMAELSRRSGGQTNVTIPGRSVGDSGTTGLLVVGGLILGGILLLRRKS